MVCWWIYFAPARRVLSYFLFFSRADWNIAWNQFFRFWTQLLYLNSWLCCWLLTEFILDKLRHLWRFVIEWTQYCIYVWKFRSKFVTTLSFGPFTGCLLFFTCFSTFCYLSWLNWSYIRFFILLCFNWFNSFFGWWILFWELYRSSWISFRNLTQVVNIVIKIKQSFISIVNFLLPFLFQFFSNFH